MQRIILPLALLTTLTYSCSNENGEYDNDDYQAWMEDAGYGDGEMGGQPDVSTQGENGPYGTRMFVINSAKFNMPMAQIPFPANWQVQQDQSGNWNATAKDLFVTNTAYQMFAYNQDPGMNQWAQQAGQNVRSPMAPEQILQQDVAPEMQKQGYQLVRQYPVQPVAMADKRGLDPLYSVAPTQKDCYALASEWSKADAKALVVQHQSSFSGGGMVTWGYYCTVLEARNDNYEQDKQALLSSLSSTQYNPQYFAVYNQAEKQASDASWARHNAKMATNQANFDAQQRNFRANSDAINNSIMGTWRNTNSMNDAGHSAYIDGIRGESNAVDPWTGESGKVESGYNQYWVNQNGQYYGTDDVLNDPNVGNWSSDQWQQMEVDP